MPPRNSISEFVTTVIPRSIRQLVSSSQDYDKSKFDHVFSGMSVWIEPEFSQEMNEKMSFLQQECGGESRGVSPFVPHVTLLYNIPMDKCKDPKEVLTKCWNEFQSKGHCAGEKESKGSITAVDWGCFVYPKSADNGKGFGCSISFLWINLSPWLNVLQKSCEEHFGAGERKGFIPHLSLVYAPEDCEVFLQRFTDEQRRNQVSLNRDIRIKYLSLWSTEGRMCDWYPIAKIPIRDLEDSSDAI